MLSQILAIVWINLQALPTRLAASLVIVVGLAGVVGVLTALMAMSQGFQSTLSATGRADRAIVLRAGSQAELNSGIDRDSATLVKQMPGVLAGADGLPLASGELIVITELPLKRSNTAANVAFRGVEPAGLAMRPELTLLEGRMFEPGRTEVVVGAGVGSQFLGAEVGSRIRMRGSEWTVVGRFASGDAHDSEIWTDLATAQGAFGRQGVSSVLVQLASAGDFAAFEQALAGDARLNLEARREVDYFSAQTANFRRQIGILATVVTVIMGIGAMFAAINTMFAAVASRAREIATLRALGFTALPVVASVLAEALLLALVGGLVGAALSWILFNGMTVTTLGQGFTQVVFDLRVSPGLLADGLLLALAIGLLGGLLPGLRAASIPVTRALREA